MISHEETNDACITWHSHKKLYQKLSTYKNYFVLLKLMISKLEEVPELILLTINEQNVSGIHQNPQLIVHPNLMYRLSFSKTVFIRKPYPFPSRCTFKTKQHKFAGLYNQKVCKFVNNDPELVTKFDNQDQSCPLVCKDTSFYFSTAVIKEIKQPCKNDKVKLSNGNLPKCEEEVKTDTIEFLNYQFLLTPQHPKSTTIEEKELYPLVQMLGKIGGFMRLMVETSCLLLLELVIRAILMVVKRIKWGNVKMTL